MNRAIFYVVRKCAKRTNTLRRFKVLAGSPNMWGQELDDAVGRYVFYSTKRRSYCGCTLRRQNQCNVVQKILCSIGVNYGINRANYLAKREIQHYELN